MEETPQSAAAAAERTSSAMVTQIGRGGVTLILKSRGRKGRQWIRDTVYFLKREKIRCALKGWTNFLIYIYVYIYTVYEKILWGSTDIIDWFVGIHIFFFYLFFVSLLVTYLVCFYSFLFYFLFYFLSVSFLLFIFNFIQLYCYFLWCFCNVLLSTINFMMTGTCGNICNKRWVGMEDGREGWREEGERSRDGPFFCSHLFLL